MNVSMPEWYCTCAPTGHDVVYTAEIAPAVSDAEVMARARTEDRVLLTADKDFGDLVFHRGEPIPGIVLLRIDPSMHELKIQRLGVAIGRFGENLRGRYTVIAEARMRARPLPR
jgi:predicted nuclease of predicted toxin-antitoxin system